jgi:hypothetical protein
MGYSVLYIAFGIVALWLLGEVLLQYKARLRWRVLAFAGFLGVVGGVAMREVVVIVLGAVAFGAGQSFVTLSYKRGFSTGWAVGGRPGSSRRRKGASPRASEPVLEVTPVEAEENREDAFAAAAYDQAAPGSGPQTDQDGQIYQPVPLQDDSGEYPLYDGQSTYTADPYTSGGYEGYGAQGYGDWAGVPHPATTAASYESGGYEQQQQQQQPGSGWGEQGYGYEQAPYQEQPAAAAAGYDAYGGYTGTVGGDTNGGYGYGGYQGQSPGYDSGQGAGDWQSQQPYPQQPQQPGADPYGSYGYDQQPYIPQQQHQSPYEQPVQQPQQPQQTYAGEPTPEYADPYDPYRY